MPCYRPLQAWRGKVQQSGKRAVVFRRGESTPAALPFPLKLPCGQCVGCRLERSRQWAMRCVHEASMHDKNCFVTLTYNSDNLPADGSLDVREFQLFMKRLRKVRDKVRYYHCGEYGENLGRPHYHACLFGVDFLDKIPFKKSDCGVVMYRSPELESLWTKGFSTISAVTFESAAYVARYVMKKVLGKDSMDHYVRLNESSGELVALKPEYTTMSRRPGIGKLWYDKFKFDIYPSDFVVLRGGKKMLPPRFYDGQFELESPDEWKRIKSHRISSSTKYVNDVLSDGTVINVSDDDCFRNAVKEEVVTKDLQLLSRNWESGL